MLNFDLGLSVSGDNESQSARIHVICGQEVHDQPQGKHWELISILLPKSVMESIRNCFIISEYIMSLGIGEVIKKIIMTQDCEDSLLIERF